MLWAIDMDPLINFYSHILGVSLHDSDILRDYWRDIRQLARETRMYPYVASAGYDSFRHSLSAEDMGIIDRDIEANRIRNILVKRQIVELAKAFADVGIPLVFLKGAASLARSLFDIEERWISDVDVLIDPKDAERARNVLRDMAYEPGTEHVPPQFHHLEPMYHPYHPGAVELHLQPYAFSDNGARLAEEILSNAETGLVDGMEIPIPSATDHAWLLIRKDIVNQAAVRPKDALELARMHERNIPVDYDLLYRREECEIFCNMVDSMRYAGHYFFAPSMAIPDGIDIRTMNHWIDWSARLYRSELDNRKFMASRSRYGVIRFFSPNSMLGHDQYFRWISAKEAINHSNEADGPVLMGVRNGWRYVVTMVTYFLVALTESVHTSVVYPKT